MPPLGILAHLARRAGPQDALSLVIWIGHRCRVFPRALPAWLLARSVFVDARDRAERVWAADLAMRSPAAGVVIADASGLGMSASRRLQLAAGVGGGLCLLARPWSERREISAAWTRWRVEPVRSDDSSPRWAIELLRCKGRQPGVEEARRWCVQRDDATGDVRVVPESGDRSDATERPAAVAAG